MSEQLIRGPPVDTGKAIGRGPSSLTVTSAMCDAGDRRT
jgi:hypothetical protein